MLSTFFTTFRGRFSPRAESATFLFATLTLGGRMAECVNDVCEKDLTMEDKAAMDHKRRFWKPERAFGNAFFRSNFKG